MPKGKRKMADTESLDSPPHLGTSSGSKKAGHPLSRGSVSSSFVSGSSSKSQPNPVVVDSLDDGLPSGSRPRKRQKKASEKRGARFKASCPEATMDRMYRAMEQRLFLLDRSRNGEEFKEEFIVKGSTGNVYTVTIDKTPSCDCPDAQRGHHCKHIIFIFLRVLQVDRMSTHWYQKALLRTELEEVFSNAPASPEVIASARDRKAYARIMGKTTDLGEGSKQSTTKKRLPSKDDDCPVCYENMFEAQEDSLTFCDQCGNGLHMECFQQWVKAAKGNATCVYCRASSNAQKLSRRPGGSTYSGNYGGYPRLGSWVDVDGE